MAFKLFQKVELAKLTIDRWSNASMITRLAFFVVGNYSWEEGRKIHLRFIIYGCNIRVHAFNSISLGILIFLLLTLPF